MQKKFKKRMIAAAVLSAVAAVGVTLAFMFKKTNTVNNFIPAQVSCTVYEKLDDAEITESAAEGSKKSDIRVKNTGNVKEYLRVRLVSYFVDEDKNITGEEPSVYPKIILKDGWLQGENNTYYYTNPVEPNEYTPVLCEPFTLAHEVTQDGKPIYQVVEVFAEAIQAQPTSAVKDAWKVTVGKENRVITSVTE